MFSKLMRFKCLLLFLIFFVGVVILHNNAIQNLARSKDLSYVNARLYSVYSNMRILDKLPAINDGVSIEIKKDIFSQLVSDLLYIKVIDPPFDNLKGTPILAICGVVDYLDDKFFIENNVDVTQIKIYLLSIEDKCIQHPLIQRRSGSISNDRVEKGPA